MRTTYLEPDYRKDPTTDFFCVRCQKSLNGKAHRFVFTDDEDGVTVYRPEDVNEKNQKGKSVWPIGLNCAKKIGIEFTFKL